MYTSYIGKKFLKLYNEKEQVNLSAKEFFDEIFFPLFFDSEQHLMHVGNSPFFQKPTQDAIDKATSKSKAQLAKLHQDISKDIPNMAIFVGYAAKDITGTTSGQLTDMDFKVDSEEIYCSWFGEALGIGISGGLVLLIDNEDVLSTIFTGWGKYREYISQTPNIKDKQIETWNGHWLCHALKWVNETADCEEKLDIEPAEVQGNLAIPTKSWSKVVFALAHQFPKQELISYAYNLSQTNTTLGFIKLYLPEIRKLYELRDKIFIDERETILRDSEIEKLETFYNFKSACKIGTIGLKAIEPKGLRAFMPTGTYIYAQGKDIKFSDDNSFYIFNIYKLWVVAMLNKTELLDLASKVAASVLGYEKTAKSESRGKTSSEHETNKILESKSVKSFIENLTEAMKKQPENADTFKQVVMEVLTLPVDNFPLFVTLIKFEYNFQKYSQEKK